MICIMNFNWDVFVTEKSFSKFIRKRHLCVSQSLKQPTHDIMSGLVYGWQNIDQFLSFACVFDLQQKKGVCFCGYKGNKLEWFLSGFYLCKLDDQLGKKQWSL